MKIYRPRYYPWPFKSTGLLPGYLVDFAGVVYEVKPGRKLRPVARDEVRMLKGGSDFGKGEDKRLA